MMDTKNPRREVAGVSDVNLAADTEIHSTTTPATPLSIASFDFGRLDDHHGSLDLITTLIDVAIDLVPPDAKTCGQATNLLFAALRIIKAESETFGHLHTDLVAISRAEVRHA